MAKKKIDSEIFKTLIEDYNIKDSNNRQSKKYRGK